VIPVKTKVLFLLTVLMLALGGCAATEEPPLLPSQAAAPQVSAELEGAMTPEVSVDHTPTEPPRPTPPQNTPSAPVPVATLEEVQSILHDAITAVLQPPVMDISAVSLPEGPEITVKNLYYELTSRQPELKYAYDIVAEAEEGLLTCRVSYMPYKTGEYPTGEELVPVDTLGGLLAVAEAHLGETEVFIRITDSGLAPDDMNRILQQVGGGYVLCMLNRDGTALTYAPAMEMTMEECMERLEQAKKLAAEVVEREVNGDMTQREKAEALYTYLTSDVKYDQRYYSDKENMPYDSQTALGALRDGEAICGGYSHALKLLFEAVGIPCYNVTGKYFRENHMWNMAQLDGAWLWFDATSDRGRAPDFPFQFFAGNELSARHEWDETQVELLLKAAEG